MSTATAAKKKYGLDYWVKILVGIFVIFILGNILPTWSYLTRTGVQQLCIFVGMLLMIGFTSDTIFPCFLGAVAMILNGYMTGADFFKSVLANATIVQQIIFFGFAAAIGQTGAAKQIAKKIITLKVVQGRPRVLLGAILMATYITGMFMGGAPALLFFFPVWESIRDALGYDKQSDLSKFMLVGIYGSVCLGGFILPFKGMILLYINYFEGQLGKFGYAFNAPYWILIAVISYLVVVVLYVIIFCAVSRKSVDLKAIKSFRADQLPGFDKASRKMTYTQKVILGAFCLCMLYSFSLSFGFTAKWKAYTGLTLNGVTFLVLALLAIIPNKETGKPFVKLDSMLKDGVFWGMIILLAVFLICGNSIGDEKLGITKWLSELVGGIFKNISWPIFVLLSVFFTLLFTQFISNFTTAMLVMAIVCPFAARFMDVGIEMTALCVAINRTAMLGYMTYSAFMNAPILLARDEMSSGWIFTKGWTLFIAYTIGTTVICVLAGYIL